ncbi:MAG: uracil-DNA glycosylase [Alphaproteobacteria bacterium]|nr:uracil-DNA glycosylase [Alphaproteobacteria bacterium]
MSNGFTPPSRECGLCPRLVAFRHHWREREASWWNAPVPPFGAETAKLLIVGLAPGLRGANATGRPFTGDYAGDTLYAALQRHGLAVGDYAEHAGDGLQLVDTRITNAVRCVPPENRPETVEIKQCLPFLSQERAALPNLKAILVLGLIAHKAVLQALGLRASAVPFRHGAEVAVGDLTLLSSYHCSRYNTNTGRLTEAMFDAVIARCAAMIR